MKEAIINDIESRGRLIGVFVETKDSKVQFVAYDSDGLITHVSEAVDKLSVTEKLEGNMIRPMFGLGK